ncbi:MAG: LamG domain-containing protein [Pedosphaera sp.]|nr:LamG domain-containing protein [Pedosphaera sp.]
MQNLTIEAWIKRGSTSVVSYDADGGWYLFGYGVGGYAFYVDANTHLYFGKPGTVAQPSAGSITDTNLHHVAITKSGTTLTFFIDGVADSVFSFAPTFVFTTPVAIGGRVDILDNSFFGTIDEIAVYNRALSTNEIQAIFAAGSAGKCAATSPPPCVAPSSGLISWWRAEGAANAYSGGCRTVIPISVGQRSNFCRTPFRFISDSVPG